MTLNIYLRTYVRRYIEWPSSVLPGFFPGGSVRFLKNSIFQKISRQWVRAPGHDMGPGTKISYQKRPRIFFLKASWRTVTGNQFLSVVIEEGLIYQTVCVCKASGNQSWMTLITGKFVEFPRLVARNLNMYQAPNLNGDCQAIWHVTNASIQEIISLLGYQRGKFIGCWTLGTRKLAKKIQKNGWKWDFGFRG